MSDVTQILERVEKGDVNAAEELLPLVYEELRKLAAHKMAQEAAGQTLLDITQDQYAYTASSTGISQLILETAREGLKFRERISDPGQRAQIVREMKAKLKRGHSRIAMNGLRWPGDASYRNCL